MDKKEELALVIKENLPIEYGKVYFYPDIPEKVQEKISKNIDRNILMPHVLAFYDTGFFLSKKTGVLFMLSGVYFREDLEEPYFINYRDIKEMKIIPDKKAGLDSVRADLLIYLYDQGDIRIGNASFYKQPLKNTIARLKELTDNDDNILSIIPTGKVEEVHLTDDQKKKCNAIIHTASVAAGGVGTGLAQLPLADNAVITPIQITMITSLGAVFGIRVTEGVAKGIIGGAAASFVGRGAVQVLLGWIPGLGNAINTATAAGLTEAIGWLAAAHFSNLQRENRAKYKIEGMKEGYTAASKAYEAKLRSQAATFLGQRDLFRQQRKEYEQFIRDLTAYISELEHEEAVANTDDGRLEEFRQLLEQLQQLVEDEED